jgi:hypothetical protein
MFIRSQQEENTILSENNVREEHIEDHIISIKTAAAVEPIPVDETLSSEPTNCAYKV